MAKDDVRYVRAPITEAVLDIQIAAPNGLSLSSLASLQQAAGGGYNSRREMFAMEGKLTGGAQVSASAKQQQIGFFFGRSDNLRAWQARLTGFAFNHFPPYTSWKKFESEARRLWTAYRSLAEDVRVLRIGLRYINHINIPLPSVEISHYLHTYPQISRELPQVLSGYFMQLQIPQDDISSVLIINQALMTQAEPGTTSILLDIDLVRDIDPPQGEQEIWNLINEFCQRKNTAFEACITDEVRRVIA